MAEGDEYVKKSEISGYIQEELKKATFVATFPDTPIPPDPEISDCKRGPEIERVSHESDGNIRVQFDGDEVFKIRASAIDKDQIELVNGVYSSVNGASLNIEEDLAHFAPDNAQPIIRLKRKLNDGETITVKFLATSCKGEGSFFYTTEGGEQPCEETGIINYIELVNI